MNICFCVDSMESGGAERVVSNLSHYFVEQGNQVSIIMVSSLKKKSFYTLNDKVDLLAICDGKKQGVNIIKKVFLLRKTIKKLAPDVVVSFLPHVNIYTDWAIRKLKIPHIVSERNNPYVDPRGKIQRFLKNKCFKKADGCVFQTSDAMKYFQGKAKGRQIIIYNPLNLQWRPDDYNFDREKKVVAVGRMQPQKNFNLLLKAFKEFSLNNKDYILEIFGDGEEKPILENIAKEQGFANKIVFRGHSPNWHKQAYKASIFVLSSDYEGMPNALLEAMALGIPSISTDCPIGGPKEIIQDGKNGFLVPVGDFKAIAEKMQVLVSDKDLSDNVAKESIKINEKLSCEEIGGQWLKFIEEIITTKENIK